MKISQVTLVVAGGGRTPGLPANYSAAWPKMEFCGKLDWLDRSRKK